MRRDMMRGLTSILEQHAELQPESHACHALGQDLLIGKTLSYGELLARSRRIALFLADAYKRDELVAIALKDGIDFLPCYFGCLLAGITCIPIDPHPLRAQQIIDSLTERLPVRALIAGAEFGPILRERSISLIHPESLEEAGATVHQRLPDLKDDDIAHLQLTSGSTSKPGIVAISHANLMSNLRQIQESFGLTKKDKGLVWLPYWHDMGLIGGMLTPVACGFPVTLMRPSHFATHPIDWLRAIATFKITISGGPPSAYQLCAEAKAGEHLDLSSWRVAFVGAEVIQSRVLDAFQARWATNGFSHTALTCCYGLAEATLMVSSGEVSKPPVRVLVNQALLAEGNIVISTADVENAIELVSSGRLSETSDLHLFASDRQCIGEIGIKGKSLARRIETPERPWRKIHHKGMSYYLTGDLGFIDQRGELFVLGRQDEQIKVFGRTLFLPDIEQLLTGELLEYFPGGVLICRMDESTHSLCLHVEIPAYTRQHPALRTFLHKLQQTLNPQCLRLFGVVVGEVRIHRRGSLARTSSGKIQRHRLAHSRVRQILNVKQQEASDQLFLEEEIAIADALREVIGVTGPISFQDSIYTLGCMSIHIPALLSRLNSHFDAQMSLAQLMQATSVRDLALAYIQKQKQP